MPTLHLKPGLTVKYFFMPTKIYIEYIFGFVTEITIFFMVMCSQRGYKVQFKSSQDL